MGTNYYVWSQYRGGWHLGKRSAGWPFLFHAQNDWDSRRALESWLEVVATPGSIIKDEYDRLITFMDLMEMIITSYNQFPDQIHPGAFRDGRASRFQFIRGEFC